MRQTLSLHPSSRCAAIERIEVEIARSNANELTFCYRAAGDMTRVVLPAQTAPARADGLWRHTCFEAFLKPPSGEAYYEFNFAPSREWAAYRFTAYRDGMRAAEKVQTPRIDIAESGNRFELRATLRLDRLAESFADAPCALGLSAVIEETSGDIFYWALKHPSGKPDFHHADCFAARLEAVR